MKINHASQKVYDICRLYYKRKRKMHYKYIDKNKENIIRDVQRLVRIKSVDDTPAETMPFGKGIGKALKEALQISSELGFDTCNLDGYAAYTEAGEGEEVVGILVHLDVVPEGGGAGKWNLMVQK